MGLVLVIVLLLLCMFFPFFFSSFQIYKKKRHLPPGPAPWPILGNLFQKDVVPLYKCYPKLVKKYGPVFTVWMGPTPMVILCGYDVIKNAFVGHAEDFAGRYAIPFNDRLTNGQGLINKKEASSRELRRFTLSTLRDFGMGKKIMSERVQTEALFLVQEIAATQGQPFDPRDTMLSALSNVIIAVVSGSRLDYKEQDFIELRRITDKFMTVFRSFVGLVYNCLPNIMEYLPGPHQTAFAESEKLCTFIRKMVKSHQQTLDPQNPRDFIDCFLIKSEKEKNCPDDIYTIGELVMTVHGLFLVGSGTTNQVLLYSLLVMAKLPHIQAKVQEEIDEVVGAKQAPEMEDRVRMPFTNAVIHEILRYEKMSLENFPRATTCCTKIKEHSIPQGTAISAVLISAHFDPLYWETPEQFNPNHFLDEKGQFRRREALISFSLGKRACPGEALARAELFLFFSTLLQKFTFHLVGDTSEEMDVISLYEDYRHKNQYPPIRAIRRSK